MRRQRVPRKHQEVGHEKTQRRGLHINGLYQGFETDGNWTIMELSAAAMNFTGNMDAMQVFCGLYGYGATHSVTFSNITVTGCTPEPLSLGLFSLGLALLAARRKRHSVSTSAR